LGEFHVSDEALCAGEHLFVVIAHIRPITNPAVSLPVYASDTQDEKQDNGE
jgi:hypothetical protein